MTDHEELLEVQRETNRLLGEIFRFIQSIDRFGIPMAAAFVGVGVWVIAGRLFFP